MFKAPFFFLLFLQNARNFQDFDCQVSAAFFITYAVVKERVVKLLVGWGWAHFLHWESICSPSVSELCLLSCTPCQKRKVCLLMVISIFPPSMLSFFIFLMATAECNYHHKFCFSIFGVKGGKGWTLKNQNYVFKSNFHVVSLEIMCFWFFYFSFVCII